MFIYLLKIIWFFLPMGLANMAPVFFKNINILNVPLDFNKTIHGKPVLGKNKTVRGLVSAAIVGGLFFTLQGYLYNLSFFKKISLIEYDAIVWYAGFFMGLGAIVGDAVKSFFKRRIEIAPGHTWIPFDQIDYVLGGILFFALFYVPSVKDSVSLLVLGFLLHMLVNVIGYYLGIRERRI